jgi:methylase of polypeptide subunit release factors
VAYDQRVQAPRLWTVAQSVLAAEMALHAPPGPILELCSGVGHIGLLAAKISDRDLVQVDSSPVACHFARENALAAGWGDRSTVLCKDLNTALPTGALFPVIVADPPWVPSALVGLHPEDPVAAIDGGMRGIRLAVACLRVIARHLDPHGAAVLQMGRLEQAEELAASLAAAPHSSLVVQRTSVHPGGVLIELVGSAARSAGRT